MRLFRAMTLVLCAAAGACQGTTPGGNSVDDEDALLKQGWSHVREGESEKAIADFSQVIALDPTHFRLIFENDRVQVIRVRLAPGEKTMIMDIPAHVMTCLTDQHVRIVHAHDKPAERRHKTGDSPWVDKNEYGLENLGEKPAEWILVVPKPNGK